MKRTSPSAAIPLAGARSGSRYRRHARAPLASMRATAPKPRAMLVLREVYGLSAEEIAATLAMSLAAVKVALWRARVQFRAAYRTVTNLVLDVIRKAASAIQKS